MKCPQCGASVPLIRTLRPDLGSFGCTSCLVRLLPTDESLRQIRRRTSQLGFAVLVFSFVATTYAANTGHVWMMLASILAVVLVMGAWSLWLRKSYLQLQVAMGEHGLAA